MAKGIFKIIILILMVVGIILGISISVEKNGVGISAKSSEISLLKTMQTKPIVLTSFNTYGKGFNVSGKVENISKDNFESVKLMITNGIKYEETYTLNYHFDESNLIFESNDKMNKCINIDSLENGEYYLLLRLKLNNNNDPKYYSFTNGGQYSNINYYTITKDNANRRAYVKFDTVKSSGNDYNIMKLIVEDSVLPNEIYDIVIDAGHGGKDPGVNAGAVTEANVCLDYAKELKEKLESLGYKVLLTRDDTNTDTYTSTNMYSTNGRITRACESKAKLMISFHINNDANRSIAGLEIYSPCKSDLSFATAMASKIIEKTNFKYSNNTTFKEADGVYVRNFTKKVIAEFENTAKRKGYEPYGITENTPYLYTIREVGGIATNAYVDGRNTAYDANRFYDSNHGIECYQIELGYIKNDLSLILENRTNCVDAIAETISNNY